MTRERVEITVDSVRCVNCGTELLPGKQFCHACGTRAATSCTSCGSTIDAGYRFCPECGTPVAGATAPPAAIAPPPPTAAEDRLARLAAHVPAALADKIRASQSLVAGERKLVTVMFCDLVGSTAIAEKLDPEEYRDLLEEYLAIAFDEIYRVEGIINQLAGDGVMALFGAPIAHEDAPQRAIHAALAIRARLVALGKTVCETRGIRLQARIGVHTGPVVVGAVGNDLKMDYTAIGDTTNLAARLQTAASPGSILASDATHRLVRGFFEFGPERLLDVKGKTGQVAAYEVRGTTEAATPMTIAEARGLTPLVGRHEELEQLLACFRRLNGNLAQLVVVVGDAGSGKSRLLYEFKQRIAEEPVVLFEARCSALGQNVPYQPWTSMLRQYFGIAGHETMDELRVAVAERLGEIDEDLEGSLPALGKMLLGALAGAEDDDGRSEEERKRLDFEAVANIVMRAGKRASAPEVMIVEDLHWIDDPSREMLELAVARIPHSPFMLLVSHRPEYQPTWNARTAFTQLRLDPLSDADTSTIIRAVAGGPLPPELEAEVLRKAEGNPFFSEEITRTLIEEGHLLRSDGQTRLTRPVAEVRLPGTIEELIAARLDRLGAHAKRVVQVAAVLGRQFHREQLAEVLDGEGIDVPAELETLERRGVIHRKNLLSVDEFRFGESVTQDVAYGGLLLRQRRELHARIGALLDAMTGERTPERAALVAHHFLHGDLRAKAVEALLKAAQESEKLPAFRPAARFYRQAYEHAEAAVADAPTDTVLQRLLLRAAQGVVRMIVIYGILEEINPDTVATRGRALAAQLGDTEALADLSGLHGMLMTGLGRDRFAEGTALIEQAVTMAREHGLTMPALRLGRARAWALLFDGRFDDARAQIDGVLAELGRIETLDKPSDIFLGAHFMRDWIYFHADDLDRAVASAQKTFEVAVRVGNRTVQAGTATLIAQAHCVRAQYADAITWAERGIAVAQQIGNSTSARTAAAVVVLAGRAIGDTGAARHDDLLVHGLVMGTEPLNCLTVVEALVVMGELRRADDYARAAFKGCGGRLREASAAAAVAAALSQLGTAHWAEAAEWYGRALDLAQAIQARGTIARICLGMGELASARGQREDAARHLETARAITEELGFARYHAVAERLLADLRAEIQESA